MTWFGSYPEKGLMLGIEVNFSGNPILLALIELEIANGFPSRHQKEAKFIDKLTHFLIICNLQITK